jgi:adenosine/AMP kinase
MDLFQIIVFIFTGLNPLSIGRVEVTRVWNGITASIDGQSTVGIEGAKERVSKKKFLDLTNKIS